MPTSSNSSDFKRGYGIALISAFILSTTAIFIRHLSQTYQLPALILAFWREIFVALTLLVVLRIAKPGLLRVSGSHLRYLVLYGFLLAAFNSTWTLSVALNGAAISTVLVYSSAAFTAILGWRFLNERLNWVKIAAIVFSLGGCVLVAGALDAGAWRSNPTGIFTGVFSGLCYSIYTLMGRSAARRGLDAWTTLFYTFAIAPVFLLFANLMPWKILPGSAAVPVDLLWLKDAWMGWLILFILAAVPTVLGYGLYVKSLEYLPSSTANLIVTIEPAITAAIAYVLLGERLSEIQVGGSFLILTGVVLLRIFEGRNAEILAPPFTRSGEAGSPRRRIHCAYRQENESGSTQEQTAHGQ